MLRRIFVLCFITLMAVLRIRARAVIIKAVQEIFFGVAIRLKSVGNVIRRQPSHHVPPVTPSSTVLQNPSGFSPRGTHTTCLRPATGNFCLHIDIQRLRRSCVRRLNSFFKFLIYPQISRVGPRSSVWHRNCP